MQRRKPNWVVWFYKLQFDTRVRSGVWRLIGDLTNESMGESDAIEAVIDINRKKKQNAVVYILGRLRYSIGQNTFPAEISKYVTPSESLMFGSWGSADASNMYKAAHRILEIQRTMKRTIFGIILPSLIGLCVAFLLYYIFGSQLFPAFIGISPLEEWSTFPRMVAIVSMAYVDNLVLTILGVMAIILALRHFIRTYSGPGRVMLDRIPPFSLYRITTGVAFLMTVIERGQMGGDLNKRLLERMARQSRGYVRNRIETMARYADQQSGGVGSAAHQAGQGYPSEELALIMAKYSERGGDWLNNFSGFMTSWVNDIQQQIKLMATGLNVFIMMVVTSSLLVAMLSIFAIVSELGAIQ